MASLSNDGGLRRIQFIAADGSRPAIRLGRIPLKTARTILAHVENLIASRGGYAPPDATTAWLVDVDDKLRARLAELGLAAPKAVCKSLTIRELVAAFQERPHWRALGANTRRIYEMGFKNMSAGLGADTPIGDVTEADADGLQAYLAEAKPTGAGLGRATCSRIGTVASMLFRFAVRSRLIDRNPFDDVKLPRVATTRRAYVDVETSNKVLAGLPDSQWRLLFGLARWGGLRVPSEPILLRWGDVDWENNRFTVTSPKTAHYEGHEARVVPIFPELLPLFEERYDEAAEGEELVLPMMQVKSAALFAFHIVKLIKRLQLDRWPRLFHSMRSTRQTELEELFPSHVVCAWLGNSEVIARKHYLQVTDAHFDKAAQKAAQTASATTRTDATTSQPASENTLDSRDVAKSVKGVRGVIRDDRRIGANRLRRRASNARPST